MTEAEGDRHPLCETRFGPFRQKVPVTFFPESRKAFIEVCVVRARSGGACPCRSGLALTESAGSANVYAREGHGAVKELFVVMAGKRIW